LPANCRAAQLREATCETIAGVVREHLPPGGYRDFVLWALAADNPRRSDYLQVTGLAQLVTMNLTLLGGLIDDETWPVVQRHLELMNAYQFFENISDNMAMGLGLVPVTGTALQRLEAITALNRAMVQVLGHGDTEPAVRLLGGIPRQATSSASAFDLSLAAGKYADIAKEYVRRQADSGEGSQVPDIEYGLWAALVANVETCRAILQAMQANPIGPLLRDGLLSRYRAVDRSLHAQDLSRMELASLGAQTILVLPTLAYGMGVLAVAGANVPELKSVLADGTLADVLYDAALLVRLQNDVGTRLLKMPRPGQKDLVRRLTRRAVERRQVDAIDALNLLTEEAAVEVALTRLHKDIVKEEFNVALWHARRAADAGAALRAFDDSVDYLSRLYELHNERMMAGLAALDDRLGNQRMTTLIERFVRFHERMYSHPYTERIGEYAV
jgi:hypothetical protein